MCATVGRTVVCKQRCQRLPTISYDCGGVQILATNRDDIIKLKLNLYLNFREKKNNLLVVSYLQENMRFANSPNNAKLPYLKPLCNQIDQSITTLEGFGW